MLKLENVHPGHAFYLEMIYFKEKLFEDKVDVFL